MSTNTWIILSLDIIPAVLTIIGNAVFFATLLKTSSLHNPSNLLLGALCVTDLVVGFVCQPLFIAVIVGPATPCCPPVTKAYNLIFGLSSLNSFICGLLITLDRYFAVFYPYKYREWANCRRYAIIASVIFVIFASYSTLKIPYFEKSRISFLIFDICLELTVIVAVLFIYAKIWRVVFNKSRAVVSVGRIRGRELHDMKVKLNDRKRTLTVAIILLTFLACYTPLMVYYCLSLLFYLNKMPKYTFSLGIWANFLALCNSCLNPLIYCARSSEIRNATIRLFTSNLTRIHRLEDVKTSKISSDESNITKNEKDIKSVIN